MNLHIVQRFVEAMMEFSPEERVRMIEAISDFLCPHCGREQPEHGHCQCNRDVF